MNASIALKKLLELPAKNLLLPDDGMTFAALAAAKLPAPRWIVNDLIPCGLGLLPGDPKLGKSLLAGQLSAAVAAGARFLGKFQTTKSGVLHLALEDTPRRFQDRLTRQLDGAPPPSNAEFFNRWPSAEGNRDAALRAKLSADKGIKLVVVDTLAMFRAQPTGKGNAYYEDYQAISQLKKIADDFGVCVLVIHHTRKQAADDPLHLVSGTSGITGAADFILMLKRDRMEADATLFTTGRDIEQKEIALRLDTRTLRWDYLGDASDVRKTQSRKVVIDALTAIGKPASPTEVAGLIGKSRVATQRLMLRMHTDGDLKWQPGGLYQLKAKS